MKTSDSGINIFNAVILCSASAIGSGILVLCYGLMNAGIIFGLLIIIFALVISFISLSIYVLSAVKLGAKDLPSLIARGVAYQVIREKRQILKRNKRHKKHVRNENPHLLSSNNDLLNSNQIYSDRSDCSSVPNISLYNTANPMNNRSWADPSDTHQNEVSKLLSTNDTNKTWNEVSDLDSIVSDVECIRNVLSENPLLNQEFVDLLKTRLTFHIKIMNFVIIATILYCIPVYFLLFCDYIQDLSSNLAYILDMNYNINTTTSYYIPLFLNYIQNRYIISFICFLIVLYPSIQSDLSKLVNWGFLSVISFLAFFLAVIYRAYISPYEGLAPPNIEPYELWAHKGVLYVIKLFNIATYCFYSHVVIIPVVNSLSNPTNKRALTVIVIFILLLGIIAIPFASIAVFTFGTAVVPNIINNYSSYDHIISIARILSALTMLVVIPLHIVPLMDSIINMATNNAYVDNLLSDVETAMLYLDYEVTGDKRKYSQASVSSYFTISIDNGEDSLEKKQEFIKSRIFRIGGSILCLAICILLSFVARSAAQFIEMFSGFLDVLILLVYPLFLYKFVWSHKNSLFLNIIIIGLLLIGIFLSVFGSLITIYIDFFS